jgi:hypothetical protein
MKTILVYFYGYKSKLLPDAVKQLLKNQSGQNKIHVIVFDQRNISRPEKFIGVEYSHIFWGDLTSRFKYMNFLKKRQNFDFFMYIDGAKMFEKNWDIELLKYQDQSKTILSGNHNIIFNKDNYKFYPEYKKIDIPVETKVNWVSKDFFFMNFDLFKTLPDISIFKYYGVEEYLSLFAAHQNIFVIAIPTKFIVDEEPSILKNDFISFSLYHNYSKIIDCFKSKEGSMPGVKELIKLIDYDFFSLNYFPYNVNDVEYEFLSNVDKLSERRFHNVMNEIY